jgi:hypothetical protein
MPHKEGWFLVALGSDDGRPSAKVYLPLQSYTGLFRTFAETKISRKSILEFANKYGALGGDIGREVALKNLAVKGRWTYGRWDVEDRRARATSKVPEVTTFRGMTFDRVTPERETPVAVAGEPLEVWASEISTMHAMLWLWEAVKQNQISDLRRVIRWQRSNGVYYQRKLSAYEIGFSPLRVFQQWIANADNPELLQLMKPGDVVTPGWHYLQRIINYKLRKHLSFSRLLWDRQNSLRLTIVPGSLISALWLQFARAVDGNRSYRTCENCRRWFEVGAETRADAKYCSNSCRQKAYRRRQEADGSGSISEGGSAERIRSDPQP